MAEKKEDIESEKERLSKIFENETENLDDFEDDAQILEGDFVEDYSEKEAEKFDNEVIQGEVVETKRTEPYLQFLETIPKDEDVTIVVSRYADKNLAGQFRVPCSVFGIKTSLYWSGENNPEELYPEVQREIGGGRYLFQIREKGKGFSSKSWTAIIHDAHEPSKLELTIQNKKTKTDEQPRKNEPSQSFVNQKPESSEDVFEKFFNQFERFESFRNKIMPPPAEPVVASNPEMALEDRFVLKILEKHSDNPKIEEKIVDAVFGIVEKKENKQEGIIDLAKYALGNPEQVKGLLGMIAESFGGVIGAFMAQKKPGQSQMIFPGQSQIQPSGLDAFRAASKVQADKPAAPVEEKQPEPPQMAPATIPIIRLED